MEQRAGSRCARVEHRLERLVLGLDQLGRVLGERTALGDDERDRLADVAHSLAREDGVSLVRHHAVLDRPGRQGVDSPAELRAGDDGDDARESARRPRLDSPEPRVCVRAADKRGVREPRKLDVVEVRRLAAEEASVLAAWKRASDVLPVLAVTHG